MASIPTSGLIALYDASQVSSSDGSFLSSIADSSGSGYNLYTVSSGGTITYNAINGKKAYSVSGGGWRATKSDHAGLDYNVDELTVSVVLSSGEAEAASRVWPFIVSVNATTSLFGFMESSPASGQWGVFLRGAATPQWSSGDIDTREWSVLTLVKNSTAITWYINGTQINSVNTTLKQPFSEINLGALIGQFFSGQIAVAGVWLNGFDTSTRAQWHSYVQDTYGIQVSDYVQPIATNTIKVRTGSGWEDKPIKYWDGMSWVSKPVKYWNGSDWLTKNNETGPPPIAY